MEEMIARLPMLGACESDLKLAFRLMAETYRSGNKVLICGNGGSAADADHWTAELLKGFRSRRPLPPSDQVKVAPQLGRALQGALPTIPLAAFPALSSAFANDVAPEFTFAQLVWGLGKRDDLLIGISTSGNATNVCAAMQTAKAQGMRTLGLSGRTGGAMRALCDVIILAPADETHLVQEYHLPIYHCLSSMLEQEFFGALQQ